MANVLHRKFKLEYPDITAAVAEVRAACNVHNVTAETVAFALRLSLIAGTAFGHNQTVTYSGQQTFKRLFHPETCRKANSYSLAFTDLNLDAT